MKMFVFESFDRSALSFCVYALTEEEATKAVMLKVSSMSCGEMQNFLCAWAKGEYQITSHSAGEVKEI